jgi:hypothetical protein
MRIKALLAAGLLALAMLGVSQAALAGPDARVFIRQEVGDYDTWRKAYDEFDPARRQMGGTLMAVFRSIDDPHEVTTINDFFSLEQARAFIASAELKAALSKGGVKGTPQIWLATKLMH